MPEEAVESVVSGAAALPTAFTIGTLVNDEAQYQAMHESFVLGGFGADCEFIRLDNLEENRFEAYGGISKIIARSAGRYIIVCHQDVRLLRDGRDELEARLDALERLDPLWALAGNAGGTETGLAMRISDPHGEDRTIGRLPARVRSLDENFIVIKRSSLVAPSADLSGFHLYGTDLCLQARMRGHTAYVIDFHLRHLGKGTIGLDYYDCLEALEDKYSALMRPETIITTCLSPVLTPSLAGKAIARLARLRKKLRKLREEKTKRM